MSSYRWPGFAALSLLFAAGIAFGRPRNENVARPMVAPIQHGTVWAGSGWTTVNLSPAMFTDPVVVAGPATCLGWAPGVVRVRNVTTTSFQIKFQEWDYLDGVHCPEHIHWLAIDQGTYDLGGGKKLIADSFVTNKTSVYYPKWVAFPEAFSETPVVLTQVQTFNGSEAVTDRICGVYLGGMHFTMQEQESKTGHCNETVGYIAVSPGAPDLIGVPCNVKRTAAVVTHNSYMLAGSVGQALARVREEQSEDAETLHSAGEKVGFISLAGQPVVIADMQTCNGADPCELRCTLLSQLWMWENDVVSANHNWKTVNLVGTYVDPVVLAGPATYVGEAPGEIRVRNVTKTSFQIRFQEWDYLDGWHCYEQMHWMVAERGAWDREPGIICIVDEFLTSNANVFSPSWVTLPLALTSVDFVLATQQTANGASCVTERLSEPQPTGFRVALQEEEAGDGIHAQENVGCFVWGTGTGGLSTAGPALSDTIKPVRLEAPDSSGVTPAQTWHFYIVEEQSKDAETLHGPETYNGIGFSTAFPDQPYFIEDMQTCNGADPCTLRCEYGPTARAGAEPVSRPQTLGLAGAEACVLLIRAEGEGGAELRAVPIDVGETVAETLPLQRAYSLGESVMLSAPPSVTDGTGQLAFSHWEVDGEALAPGQATIQVEMTASREAVAVYVSGD